MSRRRFYLLVAAALLAGLVLLFSLNGATRYEETVEHGPAPEVSSNPYLAAERFLLDQGRTVGHAETFSRLDDLSADRQILLLLGSRSEMAPQQTEQLLAWVEDGGHLVFVAEQLWDEQTGRSGDLLLDSLNLQQYETTETKDTDSVGDATSSEKRPRLTRLYLENEEAPAYFAFDPNYHLYDAGSSAHAWANSAGATHMLQLQRGSGLITALTDSWIWQNDAIANYDHAWLLWYLTQDRNVTMIYRTEHDGLLRLLLRYFPEALAAALLVLLLGCWHAAQRHGPLIESPDRGRRQLREHLRGSADFLYRRAGQRRLIIALQNDIVRQAQRHCRHLNALDHAAKCEVLARITRTSIDAVTHAMQSPLGKNMSAADFTRQVARLQSLRNAL
ncbi:DUF4350 domain-containing protein [Stutzerimonas zhaodongensis]|uniref:DUF4350 domain-containing protein n=1 Tax=Stutzerimonas TaxID=2901164 RepID=UPI00388EBD1A